MKVTEKLVICMGCPAFSPFPTMFSKVLFFRVVESLDCVVRIKLKEITSNETLIHFAI